MSDRGAPSGICEWCGEWGHGLEQDHIVPIEWDGANDTSNLQWLCKPCHAMKSGWERRQQWHTYSPSQRPMWDDAAKADALARRRMRREAQARRLITWLSTIDTDPAQDEWLGEVLGIMDNRRRGR